MKLKKFSDEELVTLSQNGDNRAFEELMRRYENKIYSLAYRILRDKEEAYDVLQETAMTIYKNLHKFKKKSAFSTWMYRIAVNFALMKKRKKKSDLITSDSGDKLPQHIDISDIKNFTDWSSDPIINIENKELKDVLDESLQKLPEKYRNVVILKDLEGRPLEEVAKMLNITVPATKSRLHRARMFLRWLLGEYVRQNYGTKYS